MAERSGAGLHSAPGVSRPTATSLAPPTIDLVRVVRRCIRCFVLGALGLIPIVGVGTAVQALRWGRAVTAEVGGGWSPARVYSCWLIGMGAIYVADRVSFIADLGLCVTLLSVQTYQLWRSFSSAREDAWNPGARQLFLGIAFAYAGLAMSLWLLAVLLHRLTSTDLLV